MKRLILTFAMVCCFALPASAVTGLGFGIHGGLGMNYSFSDVATDEAVDSLVPVDFEDNLTVIGGHVNIGTFPVLDFTIFGDYAWKSTDISDDYSFKVHDLSFGASVKKKFDVAPIIKPYLLVGGGMHAIVYTGKNTECIRLFTLSRIKLLIRKYLLRMTNPNSVSILVRAWMQASRFFRLRLLSRDVIISFPPAANPRNILCC